MTIKESLDVLAGWIEERTQEKRYPESEVKELSKALLNIRDMAQGQLIRHKWPEENPEKGQYLVARRYKYGDGKLQFTLASYWFDQRYDGEVYSPESEGVDKWGYIKNPKKIEMCWMENSDDGCRDMSDEVVYWWHLPEVTEDSSTSGVT